MDTYQSPGGAPPPGAALGYAGVLNDLLPVALWREDTHGRIVEWSLAAQDLLGYRPEEVLGRPAGALLVPPANRGLADQLTRRVQAGETVVGTLPVLRSDGRPISMEMWIVPAADPEGHPGAMLIAFETSQVLTMRDSLATLESLFTQSPIGLATLGPDLRFVRVNDALARMNGIPRSDHVGLRLSQVLPGVNAGALEDMMRGVLDSGTAVVDARRVGRTPADPGRDHIWSSSYAPLRDHTGRPLGLIASVIDITDSEQAHVEMERARHRFALLAEAGERIGTTLDLRQTAEEVVSFLVPQLADSADIQLLEAILEPDETTAATRNVLRRLAAAFPDPDGPLSRLSAGRTFQIPRDSVYERVITRARAMDLHVADIPDLIRDPRLDELRGYLATRIGSARLIPLVARGTVLGTVTVTRLRTRAPFADEDRVLVDEVVARAALNIDNARLYTTQRQAARTLQRSLTNNALPEVTGLELTGRYLPASVHDVGGDWFDVVALPGGRTGLVIGDVMGHGIHAAAVMGQLRTAVRTLARHDIPPARMLRSLDAVVADLGEYEMATCVYAVHDPAGARWTIARAGHPPPAVVTPDGTVTFLDGPPGTPLGTGAHEFGTEEVVLPSGGLLVLYTDGLIESRERDLDQGMARIARALGNPARPLDALCDDLLAGLPDGPAQDDVAMLLARTTDKDGGPVPD
ncbi:SpoIIE family protein phosphatase [Streptomyces sp. NPDC048717]|uniref:SpoIIE family protein phosphatase n=1 Tax=Streptomyces sp. NPDC048717 TaxID=3154928 RepID=UPI00343B8C7A